LYRTQEPNSLQFAERMMRIVTNRNPDSATALFGLARIIDRLEKYDEAIRLYRQTLTLDLNNALAMNNLAWLLCEEKGEYQEAIILTERALELTPQNADLLDTHGVLCLHLKRFTEAKESLENAVRLQPPNTPSYALMHFHLAQLHETLGEASEARNLFQQSLELNASSDGLDPEQVSHAQHLVRNQD
jgi:tetratricopeptide (TPR) repeat protein